jgi:hypothetical protein
MKQFADIFRYLIQYALHRRDVSNTAIKLSRYALVKFQVLVHWDPPGESWDIRIEIHVKRWLYLIETNNESEIRPANFSVGYFRSTQIFRKSRTQFRFLGVRGWHEGRPPIEYPHIHYVVRATAINLVATATWSLGFQYPWTTSLVSNFGMLWVILRCHINTIVLHHNFIMSVE